VIGKGLCYILVRRSGTAAYVKQIVKGEEMTTSTIKGTPGLVGKNTAGGDGVWGDGKPTGANPPGRGVVGFTTGGGDGVWGECSDGRGVVGVSTSGHGVWGETIAGTGVVGISRGTSPTDIGVFGKGATAGFFEGVVVINGGLRVHGQIFASQFGDTLSGKIQAKQIDMILKRIAALEANFPKVKKR
jgi:hypothetical protein